MLRCGYKILRIADKFVKFAKYCPLQIHYRKGSSVILLIAMLRITFFLFSGLRRSNRVKYPTLVAFSWRFTWNVGACFPPVQLASRNEEMRINNCQRGRCTIDFDSETSCTQVQQVFENVMLMSSIVSCFIYIILSHTKQ